MSVASYGTLVQFGSKVKVVLFKYNPFKASLEDFDRGAIGNSSKLSNNISRARSSVYELALCNPWDYFITLTLDKDKFDRFSLPLFKKFLSQWIRNYNRLNGFSIKYLLVPEQHEDGAWHIHGLILGLPSSKLSCFIKGLHPSKLVRSSYKNWGDYATKFGFCSLAPIKNHEAVSAYLVKYVAKGFGSSPNGVAVGDHLYLCSRGLLRSVPIAKGFFFVNRPLVGGWVNDYCSSEMLSLSDVSFDYITEDTVQIVLTSTT